MDVIIEIYKSKPCANASVKAQSHLELFPFEHLIAALAHSQMAPTQTQIYFILRI